MLISNHESEEQHAHALSRSALLRTPPYEGTRVAFPKPLPSPPIVTLSWRGRGMKAECLKAALIYAGSRQQQVVCEEIFSCRSKLMTVVSGVDSP